MPRPELLTRIPCGENGAHLFFPRLLGPPAGFGSLGTVVPVLEALSHPVCKEGPKLIHGNAACFQDGSSEHVGKVRDRAPAVRAQRLDGAGKLRLPCHEDFPERALPDRKSGLELFPDPLIVGKDAAAGQEELGAGSCAPLALEHPAALTRGELQLQPRHVPALRRKVAGHELVELRLPRAGCEGGSS